MWNETKAAYPTQGGMTISAPSTERRSRATEMGSALELVHKNAEHLRLLSAEIVDRMLGAVPQAVEKDAEMNGGPGMLGEATTLLRLVQVAQRDTLAALQRLRDEL